MSNHKNDCQLCGVPHQKMTVYRRWIAECATHTRPGVKEQVLRWEAIMQRHEKAAKTST